MVCSISKIALGAVLDAGLLLASDARQSLDDTKVSIVDGHPKKWSMQDLSTMAKSRTTKDAMSYLTSDAQGSGVPELDVDEMKQLIEFKPAADLRDALLMATGMNNKRRVKGDKNIVDFANTVDPAATCATEDTAGGHGIAVCVAGCEAKSAVLSWGSHDGVCHILCSLATSACTKEPVARKIFEFTKSWTKPAIACKESAIAWIAILPLKPKVAFFLLVKLAFMLYAKVKSCKLARHIQEVEVKQLKCTRDTDALKGAALVAIHERLLKRRALCVLHDFAALATYRASQEAEAAEAEAVALKAAI